jgi:hypothetical protein
VTRRALIVNDTRLNYHYGCYATASALHNLLEDDGYEVSTLSVGLTHSLPVPPLTLEMLRSDGPLPGEGESLPGYCAISAADIVVVNGEGTLHGMRRAPRNLLYMIHLAARRFGKPVYLVNHSMFPSDHDPIAEAEAGQLYRAVLSGVTAIAVRDALSHQLYQHMGIRAQVAFDLLPTYADRRGFVPNRNHRQRQVVVGIGVDFDADKALMLADTVAAHVSPATPLLLLNGGPRHDPIEERTLCEPIMRRQPRYALFEAADSRNTTGVNDDDRALDWIRTIAEAELLVTGRYHHVVAALAFGTPVVALSSNTPKIEGSYALLGLSNPVIDHRTADWASRLDTAITAARRGVAAIADTAGQHRVRQLALRNAVWRDEQQVTS